MIRRVFLVVLDSFGIGALPDASDFGDAGANTLSSIAKSPFFKADGLMKLGLGCIDGVELGRCDMPIGAHGRALEKSRGKDTTVGHWEIAGVISEHALPTYPNGFPDDVIAEFERRTGRGVICNKPYSGTQVIHDYGREHIETGKLIVYTSADSVFQIASHEDIVSVDTLYEYCKIAREMLQGESGVGRVIARPFIGEFPNFVRTPRRHDFSLEPTGKTILDAIQGAGLDVISVGKIYDIFAGRGIDKSYPTKSNEDGINKTLEIMDSDFNGLCFTNLVDFDMLYGHRNDVDGYAKAISYFDSRLDELLSGLGHDDVLIITADHGCDPDDISTDHTREYIPILVYGKGVLPTQLGTLSTYADIGATVCDMLGVDFECEGTSFKGAIMR
ncbi:MAG: phosphopentomutase [Clostridia bacterium]|nr:phosphopentomutase [Clostridia bacterium]MBQ8739902.1 phosphopentomutase [Clostridia bacterium]